MSHPSDRGFVDRLADYDSLLEIGVGRRPSLAAELASSGRRVVAMDVDPGVVADVRERAPREVAVCRDDVVAAARRETLAPRYRVEAVYARNLPAELQRPTWDLARRVDADCLFTTLGFEEPVIPVERSRLGDDVLYVVRQ
ncbi:MAG: UPF0146 family protein [Haloferacaceae archaeon]